MSTETSPAGAEARTPFASRAGFVADEATGTAAHYGNPLVEQRRLIGGTALVEMGARGVLTVTGPDRLSWLDSLTSQSLKGLQHGESTETLLLDPAGRLEHAAGVFDDGVTTWLLVEHAEALAFTTWLDRMRFMLRVEVADRSADFAVIGAFADLGLPAASPAGVPLVWVDPWHEIAIGGVGYAAEAGHPAGEWTYRETLVARDDLPALAASDVPAAGLLAFEALRIAAWRPRLTAEVDERSIPHELDWLRSAVHLDKGCYRGQETVAKVHNLGHPPRRLVMLHLDGSDNVLPAPGSLVVLPPAALSDDSPREVGHVTSSAVHFELGPVALAVVKRSTDTAAPLSVVAGDTVVAAAQQTIVPPEAGAAAGVPRLPRLGATRR
ncbi:aminomethyltransferase [Frondihabitans sp. PAMC 28766]|uniref:CAF17-like 4Fe-4S cluster assembly/insertion protein YgfZ n=1 Tax=Frondihabitans sp. PAMC 28766 TaxID=1795630 RepID=UPI00078E9919|nr:folate-binding protein YgfZ [Frondihabitans sp. PAMC 28766]AMM19915.1 aminomethyltransferase [Frondihabitans sp. PAMC 28766]